MFKRLLFVLTAVLCAMARPAAAETEHETYIRNAIPKVNARSERYLAIARRGYGQDDMTVQQMVGVMGLHIDSTAHTCAILSVLLGKGDLMAEDTRMADPGLNSGNLGDIAEYGVSLANWVYSAQRLLPLPIEDRVREWNVDCVGQLGIGREHAVFRDEEGERIATSALFEIEPQIQSVLRVLGDIEAGFSDQLQQMLDANPGIKTIALGSGGGSLGEAMKAGRMIRARKLDTTLYNKCESSCVWVFLGGVSRDVWRPQPLIGFHQPSTRDGTPFPKGHEVYALIREYIVEMGGRPDPTMELVMNTPPHEVAFGDHCETGMATFVQGRGKC